MKLKSYSVYLAAPWFSPEQKETHDTVLELLKQHTVGVRAPREIFICPPNADQFTRENTFRGNLQEIRNADLVVALTDGKDPGTLWEMGYAFDHGSPVIGCAFELGDRPFNLMLAEGCRTTCRTLMELEEALQYFDEHNEVKPQDWKGPIE